MDCIEVVKRFIDEQQLLATDSRYLVAVSGGADSVCLLLMLQQLGYRIEAVHCNFKLRGEESDRDEQFVVDLCQRLAVPLHTAHFDTRTYASLHKVSIEMAARELRYHYFEQLRHDLNAQAVCVAHHQDDSVETILMNLLRGTGLRGLTGIKPRNGHIVRPLLCVSRHDIEKWLEAQGQPYVTDSTNLEADVVRNKLRLNVIPQLQAITPSATDNILATAHRLAEAERVYNHGISHSLSQLVHDDALPISALLGEPSPESILFEWLAPRGFSPATIEHISQRLPEAQNGRQWLSDSHVLTVHQGRLLLSPIQADRPTLRIPETGLYAYDGAAEHFRVQQEAGSRIVRKADVACFDAARIRFPLTLRPMQPGDRFQPFGMKGTRLVSDYLTDRKLSVVEKRRQLVLTDAEGHILWLVDHRPDGHYCVTPQTQQTLIIRHERR